MNNKMALASLALDLRRVALGYRRGSIVMAERFLTEAMKRRNEINIEQVKPYIRTLLKNLDFLNRKQDQQHLAEDYLTYSILFQNAATESPLKQATTISEGGI